MRFIDLATDGGCSQKASAMELSGLLRATAVGPHEHSFRDMQETFPDVGIFSINEQKLLSTVDILFPMVNDQEIFGRIVVNHVLNDIYASLGVPRFGLVILGAPRGIAADDNLMVQMLSAATLTMNAEGAPVIGGHSLSNQESLFLGLSVVGTPIAPGPQVPVQARDPILITKRLGTSIASLRWKLDDVPLHEHKDVVDGMLQSSATTSKILARNGISHCTDVSGFGFVNNLLSLLTRVGVGANIEASAIPIYESIKPHLGPIVACTRQAMFNMEFCMSKNVILDGLDRSHEAAWMDAQTAGGMIFICPASVESRVSSELISEGVEVTKIGNINASTDLFFSS